MNITDYFEAASISTDKRSKIQFSPIKGLIHLWSRIRMRYDRFLIIKTKQGGSLEWIFIGNGVLCNALIYHLPPYWISLNAMDRWERESSKMERLNRRQPEKDVYQFSHSNGRRIFVSKEAKDSKVIDSKDLWARKEIKLFKKIHDVSFYLQTNLTLWDSMTLYIVWINFFDALEKN